MKDKYSTTCIAGFILSTVIPLPLAALAFFNFSSYDTMVLCTFVILASMLLGLVFSILGVVEAKKKNKKGKIFGILGIIISVLGMISIILFNVLLLWLATGLDFG